MKWSEEDYMAYQQEKGFLPPPTKKPPKYHNIKTTVDGIHFDSAKEASYYADLQLLLKAGQIKGFCRQPEFILQEGFGDIRPIIYKPDFIVIWNNNATEIIDTKGFLTDIYKTKKKLFKKKFPHLSITEVQ